MRELTANELQVVSGGLAVMRTPQPPIIRIIVRVLESILARL
jgi:bacteriocin-like protein